MPVTTIITSDAETIYTTYRVDIQLDIFENLYHCTPGSNYLQNVSVFKDWLTPNTLPPNTSFYKTNFTLSDVDRAFSPGTAVPANVTLFRNGPGPLNGASRVATWSENPGPYGGNVYNANVYYLDVPPLPIGAVLEVDCGYPFGTVHIISDTNGLFVSAATPPSGWVRNDQFRKYGATQQQANQVNALGNQFLSRRWMGVNGDGTSWNRNGYFIDSALPVFKLYWPHNGTVWGSGELTTFNYQTSSVYKSGINLTGQWYGVDHNDSPTYYPIVSAVAFGAQFNIPFTDQNPAGNQAYIRPDWATILTPPALPANTYQGLYLALRGFSDWIDAAGVTQHAQAYTTIPHNEPSAGKSVVKLQLPYIQPPYWPYDMPLVAYGPDDATVRWVRHVGYAPATSGIPAVVAQTNVAPVLSRVGNVIIFQGGYETYPNASPVAITSSTPVATGVLYPTDIRSQNVSASSWGTSYRIVTKEYSSQWSTGTANQFVDEYTTGAGVTPSGVKRWVALSRYNSGTITYSGPGITLTDIIYLTANAVGTRNEALVTNSTAIKLRGMSGGSVSTAANGIIFLTAQPLVGKSITINDGTGIIKTWYFNSGGANIIVIAGTINGTVANIVAAINAGGLAVTASIPSPTDLTYEVTHTHIAFQSGGTQQDCIQWTGAVP